MYNVPRQKSPGHGGGGGGWSVPPSECATVYLYLTGLVFLFMQNGGHPSRTANATPPGAADKPECGEVQVSYLIVAYSLQMSFSGCCQWFYKLLCIILSYRLHCTLNWF